MLMKHIYLMLVKFLRLIVVMNAENILIVTVIYMNLQAFALQPAVIPCRFNLAARDFGILETEDHIIEFLGEIAAFSQLIEQIAVIVSLMTHRRKGGSFN